MILVAKTCMMPFFEWDIIQMLDIYHILLNCDIDIIIPRYRWDKWGVKIFFSQSWASTQLSRIIPHNLSTISMSFINYTFEIAKIEKLKVKGLKVLFHFFL